MSLGMIESIDRGEILLVDTNRGSYPLWRALAEQERRVSVVGADPDAPLAKLSSNYIKANYSDAKRMAEIVRNQPYVAIVPGCTDASYLACATLPGGPPKGVDSPEVAQQLFQKRSLRQLADELGIRQPAQLTETQALSAPCVIVKPVDGFSGAGITKLVEPTDEALQLAKATARKHSHTGQVLLEEYLEGQLYSHSAFIAKQKIVQDFFVQESCIDYPYAVDTSCVAHNLVKSATDELRSNLYKIAHHLDLVDGLIHTQFILRGGEAYLIEITRRHPGDLYGLLIQYSTGFDYAAQYLNAYLPKPIKHQDLHHGSKFIVRHTITAGTGCNFWSLKFKVPVLIRQWIQLAKAGDKLEAAPKGRAAIAFFETKDQESCARLYKQLAQREIYSFQSD